MKNLKKLFLLSCLTFIFSGNAEAIELPEKIDGWLSVDEFVTNLIPDASSEDLGRYIYKDYSRRSPRGSLRIILTEGKGFGSLRVPDEVREIKNSDFIMKSETGYKILEVSGHKAIFEKHEILPDALAISVSPLETLTLESNSLNENELINLAEKILK